MYLIESQNKNDKDYGQECKEYSMCIGPFRPRRPPPPPPPSDAEIEAQQARDSAMAEETAARGEAREDTLESNVRRKRKGVGRRSLLRGSGGGQGFYSRYDS
tara:strand:+ start:2524 stop:2829 length:306 start_codon:yes stop_codon:yes gene_type:complete